MNDKYKYLLKSKTVNDFVTPSGDPILYHWARRLHRGDTVPEGVLFGSVAAELIYGGMARKDDMARYRKAALWQIDNLYPEHEAARMRADRKLQYEEAKAHIMTHVTQWENEAHLRAERDQVNSGFS